MPWKRALDYPVYVIVRIFICIVQAITLETGVRIARLLAWLFGEVFKIRARVVDENLRHAFPELSAGERKRLARQMWEHLFTMVLEVAHAPRKIHETNWREYIHLRGERIMLRMLMAGRPTLLTTAHFSNFELAGYGLGLLGFPTHAVARTLDNPYLDRFLGRFRGATGQYLIPKNGGYDQIVEVLRQGGTMSFLADQYAGPKGCWVQFFGRPASAHKAIALLAMEHQAPVIVAYARRTAKPLHFELVAAAVADPLQPGPEFQSVKSLTQWYTAELEKFIRIDPGQYWWLHRRWKDTREPKGAKKAA